MTELLTYAKFHTNNELEAVTTVLDKAGITYLVEREKGILDKIYTGESFDPMIALKIAGDNFIAVNELMVNQVVIDIDSIHKDYYLLNFTVAELTDIVKHPLEWNYFDQALAKYLLAQQEITVPIVETQSVTEVEFEPIGLATQWLILEYLLSIIFTYAGIIIGAVTLIAYKTLPNGKKVAIYNHKIRNHGKWLLAIGIIRCAYHFYWRYSN